MNFLNTEKSPYLLQHVANPVDWYPWAEPAFARARDENKLIFLSIGYSTCHWCHVMAHECFEDEDVAELLNRDYISIKVDREERPDIDQVYMEVCQRMTGSGGWPLTIVMTPDARPFYAATYVPKQGQQGRPGLMNLLPWITEKWLNDPDFLSNAAQDVVNELQSVIKSTTEGKVTLAMHTEALQLLKKGYDSRYGGFGQAPKFPRPHDFTFLLNQYQHSNDQHCLTMAEHSLQMMRRGGIYDHLGFGFHRYATDEKWLVPHFEKMLYDQAGLIRAYLMAWQVTDKECYAATVREIIDYLMRQMMSVDGALFSAEDADSEGVEGKFYLWTEDEINACLEGDAQAFMQRYQVSAAGNYHDEVTGQLTGSNILHLAAAPAGHAETDNWFKGFSAQHKTLFEIREQRIKPHLDDKVIAAWNGMVISALAESGRLLGEQVYIDVARKATDFVLTKMRDQNGRLFRRHRQGEAAVAAFSEDYAFMGCGLLDLYAAAFDLRHLEQAIEFAELLRELFLDPVNGRLYDTPTDGEKLLVRPSSTFDGATPSASAAALELFARLSLMTGEVVWREAAEQLLQSLAVEVVRYPAGYTQLLQSANWLLRPTREVVIVGTPEEPSTQAMLQVVRGANLQQTVVLFHSSPEAEALVAIAPFVKGMRAGDKGAAAYVCQNFACHKPLLDAAELAAVLNSAPD